MDLHQAPIKANTRPGGLGPLGTLVRAQFSRRAAEETGRWPWAVAVALLLLSTMMAAFPFVYGRFTRSWDGGQAVHYPGLGTAWLAAVDQGGAFRFDHGRFIPDAQAPRRLTAGAWTVYLDPADHSDLKESGPFLRFIDDRIAVGTGTFKIDGPASVLDGVSASDLRTLAGDRERFTTFVKGSLFAMATTEVPSAFLGVTGLMLAQNLLFVLVLGTFLSFSAIPVAGSIPNARRRAGWWPSVKTVAVVSVGPSLVAALIGCVNPSWGLAFGMLAYSLLLGIRVITLYLVRFRDKNNKGTKT